MADTEPPEKLNMIVMDITRRERQRTEETQVLIRNKTRADFSMRRPGEC